MLRQLIVDVRLWSIPFAYTDTILELSDGPMVSVWSSWIEEQLTCLFISCMGGLFPCAGIINN